MFLDPAGQLSSLIRSCVTLRETTIKQLTGEKIMLPSHQFTYFIGKDHQAVVCFSSDDSAHTLSRMAHCIKRQKVIFPDLKLFSEVFQPCLIRSNRSAYFYTLQNVLDILWIRNVFKIWEKKLYKPWGFDSGCKRTVLQTWWRHGQNDELGVEKKQQMFTLNCFKLFAIYESNLKTS